MKTIFQKTNNLRHFAIRYIYIAPETRYKFCVGLIVGLLMVCKLTFNLFNKNPYDIVQIMSGIKHLFLFFTAHLLKCDKTRKQCFRHLIPII